VTTVLSFRADVDRAASSAAACDWVDARVDEARVSFGPGDENNAEKPGAKGAPGTRSRHTRCLASYLAIEMAPMDKAESIMACLRSPLCHYAPPIPRRTTPAGICRAAALLCAREHWLPSQSPWMPLAVWLGPRRLMGFCGVMKPCVTRSPEAGAPFRHGAIGCNTKFKNEKSSRAAALTVMLPRGGQLHAPAPGNSRLNRCPAKTHTSYPGWLCGSR
jgi:hypothetical protein